MIKALCTINEEVLDEWLIFINKVQKDEDKN